MPINELEIHPYLDCINYKDYNNHKFKSLIIGSFPVYGITNTLTPDNNMQEHPFNDANSYMRFFYGSKKNSFWRLFANALGEDNPVELPLVEERKQTAIDILIRHKFLITDVLLKTNRVDELAEDSNLWVATDDEFVLNNRSLNYGIENILEDYRNIKYLYFTATGINGKSPFGWFQEIFQNNLQFHIIQQVDNRLISAEVTIGKRKFIAFFLPSPAGNGTRGIHFADQQRTQTFVNYIQSVEPIFYHEIANLPKGDRTLQQKRALTRLRKEFLSFHYHEVLQNINVNFNGMIV